MAEILKFFIVVSILLSASVYAETTILRIPLNSKSISLDPTHIQDVSSLLVSRQINCQLIRNKGGIYSFEAAKSIKYISPLQIQIVIDQSKHFSDGSVITAEDVVASFNYAKNTRSALRNIFQWVGHIKIFDEKTILLELKKPIPQILTVLASPNYSIYKKSFLEKANKTRSLWYKPIGCGGYKIVDYTDNYIHLEPLNSGLPITFYLDNVNQIKADAIDQYDLVSLRVIGDSPKLKDFTVVELFDPSQVYIGLNALKSPWISNENRCRFLSKINTAEVLKKYSGTARLAKDFLPPGTLGFDPKNNFMLKVDNEYLNLPAPTKKSFCLAYLVGSVPEQFREEYLNMVRRIYPDIKMVPISQAKEFGDTFLRSHCDAIIFSLKSNYFDGYEYIDSFANKDEDFSGLRNNNLISEIENSQNIIDPRLRSNEYRKIINKVSSLCLIRPLLTIPNRKIYIRNSLKAPGIGEGPFNDYYLGNIK